jgi:hypothetical protein
MELNVFIRETLGQIVSGVREAQTATQQHGANINPTDIYFERDGQHNAYSAMPQDVHFDVALTSTETGGATGGIGVFLGAIKVGTEGKLEAQTSAVTRVQFTVPVVLPLGKSMKEEVEATPRRASSLMDRMR